MLNARYITFKPNVEGHNNQRFYDYITKFNFKVSNNVLIVPTNIHMQDQTDPEYSMLLSNFINQHAMEYQFICFQLKPTS